MNSYTAGITANPLTELRPTWHRTALPQGQEQEDAKRDYEAGGEGEGLLVQRQSHPEASDGLLQDQYLGQSVPLGSKCERKQSHFCRHLETLKFYVTSGFAGAPSIELPPLGNDNTDKDSRQVKGHQ